MRDTRRIDRILNKLREIWKENPDLRFNQLLINLNLIPDGSHWFLDDNLAEEILKKH